MKSVCPEQKQSKDEARYEINFSSSWTFIRFSRGTLIFFFKVIKLKKWILHFPLGNVNEDSKLSQCSLTEEPNLPTFRSLEHARQWQLQVVKGMYIT